MLKSSRSKFRDVCRRSFTVAYYYVIRNAERRQNIVQNISGISNQVSKMGPKRKRQAEESTNQGAKATKNQEDESYTHWLMKSEPESRFENGVDVKFGLEDLKKEPDQTACWDGVRNYSARNFMKAMKVGQKAFFYHSNCKPPGVAGLVEIVKESYVDHTQFDKKDPHYDPKSSKDNPKWFMVDVKYVRDMKRYIPLHELKELHLEHKSSGGPLANLALFTKARLSVQPLTKTEFDFILNLEKKESE